MNINWRNIFNMFNFDTEPNNPDFRSNLLKLHNNVRKTQFQLIQNTALNNAAQKYAELMAKNYPAQFSHEEAGTDIDRANAAGYNSYYVGENIAEGATSVDAVFKLWYNSPGHYANIINQNYKDVGFGYAESSNGSPLWCALFGRIW